MESTAKGRYKKFKYKKVSKIWKNNSRCNIFSAEEKKDYTYDKDKIYTYMWIGRKTEKVADGELPQLVVLKIEDFDQNNQNVKHLIS